MDGCSGVPAAGGRRKTYYGRIWHQARAGVIPGAWTSTQPTRRPYDLRHAALSLWLASGAPPAEIAARAGHSVLSCSPSSPTAYPATTRSPASRSSKPSAPADGPPLAHKNPRRRREPRPSCVRATAGLNGTRLDLEPLPRSGETPVTCGNTGRRRTQVHGLRPQTGGPRHPSRPPRRPGQIWPTTGPQPPGTVCRTAPDTHQTRHPGIPGPGLTWGF